MQKGRPLNKLLVKNYVLEYLILCDICVLFSSSSKFGMTLCWYLSRSLRGAIAFQWTFLYHFHTTAPMDVAVLNTGFSLDLKLGLIEHFRD